MRDRREVLLDEVVVAEKWAPRQAELYKRILLLDLAFHAERCTKAAEAFLRWLYGPTQCCITFSGVSDQRYWILQYHTFKGSYSATLLETRLATLVHDSLVDMSKNPSNPIALALVAEAQKRVSAANLKVGATLLIGDFSPLSHPTIYLGKAVSVELWESFFRTTAATELSSLTHAIATGTAGVEVVLRVARALLQLGSIPDDAATLGSYSLFPYLAGTVLRQDKTRYVLTVERMGKRICDSYDFNGSQFLGFWYPDAGHKPLHHTLVGPLCNDHFREFASTAMPAFNRYLEVKGLGDRRLVCQDYRLVSEMITETIEPSLQIKLAFDIL